LVAAAGGGAADRIALLLLGCCGVPGPAAAGAPLVPFGAPLLVPASGVLRAALAAANTSVCRCKDRARHSWLNLDAEC
jgi:hypothetical protein